MKNINLNLDLNKINFTELLLKIYPKIIILGAILIIGWTAYFLTNLIFSDISGDSLTTTESEVTKEQITFNKKTLQSLDQLTQTDNQVDISNVGRENPFKPTN